MMKFFRYTAASFILLFALVAMQTTANAAVNKVRVGISTKKSPLQLWSETKLIITDKAQPSRKMVVAPQHFITLTKTSSQRIRAHGDILQGSVSIKVDDKNYPAWQIVEIRPLDWHHFIRLSSNGESAQWSRPYRGTFEITPQTYSFSPSQHQNPLRVVNEVSMEDYLKGVVPWEMTPSSPLEALKAQAICARSETLYKIQHGRHRKDGYEICDYDHCQGYPGTENENPRTSAAVQQTAGYILTHNGAIVDAVYGTNSGGITADSTDVWRGGPVPYLRNVLDYVAGSPMDKVIKPVMTEADWKIYCSTNLPSFAQPTKEDIRKLAARRARSSAVAALYLPGDLPSFYRWSRTITGAQLLDALGSKMQPRVNRITELRVLLRAPSGHIKKLQIIGQWVDHGAIKSTSTLTLEGDGAIRSMLSGRLGSTISLPSSTFVVFPHLDANKFPTAFTLKGAGFGHGVGMCQTGAINHARHGWNARQILNWYYRDVEIRVMR